MNDNLPVKIIIDTGAACNVVRLDCISFYQKPHYRENLYTAGNIKIPILGTTTLQIKINDRSFTIIAKVVKNLSTNLILGMAFLKKYQAILDVANHKIQFGDTKKLKLNSFHSLASAELPQYEIKHEPKIHKLQLGDEVILKSGESKRIALISVGKRLNYFHETYPNFKFLQKKNLIMVNAPKIRNKKLTVEIKSNNIEDIKLMKNTTLAYFYNKNKRKPHVNLCQASRVSEKIFKKKDYNISAELSASQQEKLYDLINEYLDIFSFDMSQIGRTHLTQHDIELVEGAKPVRKRPYRVSLKEQEIINKQVNDMLEYKIVEESNSPFASPVVLVKKKGGKEFRLAVDYRNLNAITRTKEIYPLPLIEDCLSGLYGSKYYTTLDCFNAYFQIPLTENAKEKTAFVTTEGHYQFNVLPFGLTNGPSTFAKLGNKIFRKLKNKSVIIYLDDIIIHSEDFDSHIKTLTEVFKCLREANLTLKPSKCQFLKTEIEILGYKIDAKGIYTTDTLIKAVKEFPVPKNVKQLQRFLGLVNFYRKFIENMSQLCQPLYNLLKKDVKFLWTKTEQQAFELLKHKLVTAPVLCHYNPLGENRLHVDASRQGLGCVFLQKQNDGEFHPVFFLSRSLTKAERNYDVLNLEATCIIWALKTLRQFIYGRKICIYTDHNSLCHLRTLKNPMGRMARYLLVLSDYDADIVHRAGKMNVDCDCLSRAPVNQPCDEDGQIDLPLFLIDRPNLGELQSQEPYFSDIIQALKNPRSNLPSHTIRAAKNYVMINNILYKKNPSPSGFSNLLVVPTSLRKEILFDYHNHPLSGGHLGFTKTYNKIKDRYFWHGLLKDVRNYVLSCVECQLRKETTNKGPPGLLHPIRAGTPFSKISIDLMGPLHRTASGKTFICVASDLATRYVETGALRDSSAKAVAEFIFRNITCRHGCPREILSDRGSAFKSELMSELLKIMGINQLFTTAYKPSTNGLTERFNASLKNMLSLYVNSDHKNWDHFLPFVTLAYNSSKQPSMGYSPFMLVYGREPRLPTDACLDLATENPDVISFRDKLSLIRNLAIQNLEGVQAKTKTRYDQKHSHVEYNVGDQVKIFNPSRKLGKTDKFLLKWHGPYTIIKRHNDVNYVIKFGNHPTAKTDVVHVSRIRHFRNAWQD